MRLFRSRFATAVHNNVAADSTTAAVDYFHATSGFLAVICIVLSCIIFTTSGFATAAAIDHVAITSCFAAAGAFVSVGLGCCNFLCAGRGPPPVQAGSLEMLAL